MTKPTRKFSLYHLLVDTMVKNNIALRNKMFLVGILLSNIKEFRVLRSKHDKVKVALNMPQKFLKSSVSIPQECPLDLTLKMPQKYPLDLRKQNKTKLVHS